MKSWVGYFWGNIMNLIGSKAIAGGFIIVFSFCENTLGTWTFVGFAELSVIILGILMFIFYPNSFEMPSNSPICRLEKLFSIIFSSSGVKIIEDLGSNDSCSIFVKAENTIDLYWKNVVTIFWIRISSSFSAF